MIEKRYIGYIVFGFVLGCVLAYLFKPLKLPFLIEIVCICVIVIIASVVVTIAYNKIRIAYLAKRANLPKELIEMQDIISGIVTSHSLKLEKRFEFRGLINDLKTADNPLIVLNKIMGNPYIRECICAIEKIKKKLPYAMRKVEKKEEIEFLKTIVDVLKKSEIYDLAVICNKRRELREYIAGATKAKALLELPELVTKIEDKISMGEK